MGNQAVKMSAGLTAKVKKRMVEEQNYQQLLKEVNPLPEGVIENQHAISTIIDANEIVEMANSIETTIRKLREDYEQAILDNDPSKVVCDIGMLQYDEETGINRAKLSATPKGEIILLVINVDGEDQIFDGTFNIVDNTIEVEVEQNWHLAQYTVKYLK